VRALLQTKARRGRKDFGGGESDAADGEKDEARRDFLGFRGMRFPPSNEQGVVYLFGMVSREIGFEVEAIRSKSYPDCVARRRLEVRPGYGKWRKVMIEFEYRSSKFRLHNHDPTECDIIVCWENDWPSCPIEVIELKNVVRQLPRT
jgi:hypothetical protein